MRITNIENKNRMLKTVREKKIKLHRVGNHLGYELISQPRHSMPRGPGITYM